MSLVEALQDSTLFDHPVTKFEVIETHISWVLLTGPYAYKIKKPVSFGFLDFSSLAKRHLYSIEEVRLNCRLASQLYLGVVTICGSVTQPNLVRQGVVIEYAVKMRQFPQSAQLDRLLSDTGLDHRMIDELAGQVANFHLSIKSAPVNSALGDWAHIRQPILGNFQQIRTCITDKRVESILNQLEHWSQQQLDEMNNFIWLRKVRGFIRECHGDMHLANIAWWDDKVVIFDCIEFNKNFFWIDVMSEIAFLVMDLEDKQQHALANRFLNLYLEETGDYAGVQLLNFYKVYRAMVRAKVAALCVGQERIGSQATKKFTQYLQLAKSYITPANPYLLINHGLSGSGKSFASRLILEKLPAIQIRSDVERKRLFQGARDKMGENRFEEGIYSAEATRMTYMHLINIAKALLIAGCSVLIDAANLKRQQCQLFIDLAHSMHIPYLIIDYQASVETLRKRINKRNQQNDDVSDATLAVLEHQLATIEPLVDSAPSRVIIVDTDQPIEIDHIIRQIKGCVN